MALPVSKNTNYGIFVACLVALLAAVWFGFPVLADLQSWNDWDKPAEVAKLRYAIGASIVAGLLALGVNVFELLRPVLALVPGFEKYLPAAPAAEDTHKHAGV